MQLFRPLVLHFLKRYIGDRFQHTNLEQLGREVEFSTGHEGLRFEGKCYFYAYRQQKLLVPQGMKIFYPVFR